MNRACNTVGVMGLMTLLRCFGMVLNEIFWILKFESIKPDWCVLKIKDTLLHRLRLWANNYVSYNVSSVVRQQILVNSNYCWWKL